MNQVASLYGLLSLRDEATPALRQFEGGLTGVADRLRGLGGSLERIGGNIAGLGVGITAAMAPFAAAVGGGITVAANFETVLAEIQARAQLTGDEMAQLTQFALRMGAETVFSSQQAAEAFLQLVAAGSTVEEAFVQLPAVLEAAAAGGLDLGRTADMITDIMSGFGLEVDQTSELVDRLARASGSSSATMSQLMDAMAGVGPVAAQFGLSASDTVATLAQMADFGIKGAEAGTALRSMLLNLNRPTQSTSLALERLGISLYNTDGSSRNLRDVLRELSTALRGLPAEEANALAVDLAGSYGIVAFNALMASGGIDAMAERMELAAGAGDVAAARMNTFSGRVNSLRGSIETLAITALTPFMNEVLTPLAERLIELVNHVTAWASANPELVRTIVTVGAAITGLGGSLTGLGLLVRTAGAAISGLAGLLTALTSPIGLVIALIGGLVAAYLNNWGGVRDFIDGQVRPALDRLFEFLAGVWEQVRPALESVYEWFVNTGLPAIRDFVVDTVVPAIEGFFEFLAGVWEQVRPALESVYEWFVNTGLPAIRDFVVDTVVPAVTHLIELLSAIWERARPGLEALRDNVIAILGTVGDWIQSTIGHLDTLISRLNAWQGAQQNASVIVGGLQRGQWSLGDVFGATINAIRQEIRPRAMGGLVEAGRPYLVGERGPELYIPGRSGMVMANDRLGGVMIQQMTVHADGLPAREVERVVARALLEVMR